MAQNPDEEDVGMIIIQPAESWTWNSKDTLIKTIQLHQMHNMNLAFYDRILLLISFSLSVDNKLN